jgi:hypothetical protein
MIRRPCSESIHRRRFLKGHSSVVQDWCAAPIKCCASSGQHRHQGAWRVSVNGRSRGVFRLDDMGCFRPRRVRCPVVGRFSVGCALERTRRSAPPRRWFWALSAGCVSVHGLGVLVPVVCAPWGVRCRSTVDSAGWWPLDQQVENRLYGRPAAAWWGARDDEQGVVPFPLEPLPGFGPWGGRLSGGTAVAEPPATFLSPFRAATR